MFLLGTGSCYGCGKEGHKVRNCPMIVSRGREGKKVAPRAPKKMLQRRGISMHYGLEEKPDGGDDDMGKSLHLNLEI